MSNLDLISSLAFHREHVASRRLAKRAGISMAAALELVLIEVAGVNGLPFLLEQRRADFAEQAKLKENKRQLAQQRYASKISAKTIPAGRWCAWFDGSARPNPGPCSIGGVLQAADGHRWEISLMTQYGSSSVAEYQALIAVLELALMHSASDLIVFGDSRVVIDDLDPQNKKQAQGLEQYRQIAHGLMQQLVGVQLQWIPRARNGEADALAQQAFERANIDQID
jgi:ribonuclease HI